MSSSARTAPLPTSGHVAFAKPLTLASSQLSSGDADLETLEFQPAVMFVRGSEPFYILCLCFPYAWYVWDEKMLLPRLLAGKGNFSDNLSSQRKEFMLWR